MSKIKILIASNNKTEHKLKFYLDWINIGKELEIKVISMNDKITEKEILSFDGLILTGGSDVSDLMYKPIKPELIKTTDNERDKFESMLLNLALKSKIPILGICRGLQFVNTFFGGTLYEDLVYYKFSNHSIEMDKTHKIIISKNSVLNKITKSLKGFVNSSHHQSAKKIGKELRITSKSVDGVVESLEWKNPNNKSFLLLVQWHPERMKNKKNRFSKNIKEKFLMECLNYSNSKKWGKNEVTRL